MHALTKVFLAEVNREIRDATLLVKARRRIRKGKLLLEGERVEDLETRGLIIIQPKKGYRFNSDSVILANLAMVNAGDKVYDLGCGSGVISLLIAAKKGAKVVGVELQDALVRMAQKSVRANAYQDRVTIVQGDIRDLNELPQGDADVVVMNPPYFKAGSGEVSHDEMAAIARHEIAVTLTEELSAIKRLMKEEGKAYILFPTSREAEFDKEVKAHDLCLAEKTYLTASADKAPESFIALLTKTPIEIDLSKEAPTEQQTNTLKTRTLVTKDEKGNMSKEVAALYRS